MLLTLSPTDDDITTAMRSFLLAILPPGVEAFVSQENYVPEPAGANFVMMTPLLRDRLETNTDDEADVVYTGSISDATMTVTAVAAGPLVEGQSVFGVGVADGTVITAIVSGGGGPGVYTISPGGQTVSSETLAGGGATVYTPTQLSMQLDFHGPDGPNSVQKFINLFRDSFGVKFFASLRGDVVPLHADSARQAPFINGEQNYETRWTTDAIMQINELVIGIPQQFAAALGPVALYEVDAAYPD